jgi:hypothetical protein
LDDPELYPSFDEIMVALQDVGTKVTKGKAAGEIRYTLLIKAVMKTQKTLLAKYKNLGFPKNPTECKQEIANHCIRIRKLKDVINLPTEFHNYKNTLSPLLPAPVLWPEGKARRKRSLRRRRPS